MNEPTRSPKTSPTKATAPSSPTSPVSTRGASSPISARGPSSPSSGRSSTPRKKPPLRRQSSYGLHLHHANSIVAVIEQKQIAAALKHLEEEQVPWWTSRRFVLAIICFWGFGALYSQRVNLSMAMVCMVDHEHFSQSGNDSSSNTSLRNDSSVQYDYHDGNATYSNNVHQNGSRIQYGTGGNSTRVTMSILMSTSSPTKQPVIICPGDSIKKKHEKNEFSWDKELQALILGSFFWGYLILQVPGGWLAEHFGAKKIIAFGMFPVAILNLLSPICARVSPYLLIVVRVIMGLGEAVMYPAAQALWAKWAPPHERSRLVGISYAGGQFGNAMAFPLSSLLCSYGFDGGWPSVFYVFGAFGFIWCCVWVAIVHDSPAESIRITAKEKRYIEAHVIQHTSEQDRNQSTPWKKIFTSRAVWAIFLGHTLGNYGVYMLLTQLPTYLKEVLKFDIKSNGVFSMLPYLCFWGCISIAAVTADKLIDKNILSIGNTRKLMSAIGLIVPGALLIATGYMDCTQHVAAVALLTGAVGVCGFQFAGYFVNHGDIAPQYAGTLFGLTNTAATIPGILAPYIVSAVTPNRTREEWMVAFYIAGGVYFLGAILYVSLASGEVQEWARTDETAVSGEDFEEELGRLTKSDGELHQITEEDGELHHS